jgi:hypothetical protein
MTPSQPPSTPPLTPPGPFLLERWVIVLLVALTVSMLLYVSGLTDPPLFDDYFFMIVHDHPNDFHLGFHPRAIDEWTITTLRQLTTSLAAQRLVNIVFHAINASLVFLFCRQILRWLLPAPARNERKLVLAAFVAALVFLVHPAAVYAVAYLNQRSTELASMGMLLTLLVFWRALEEESLPRHGLLLALAALLYMLSLLGKEHAIMAPALCLSLAVMHDGGLRLRRLPFLIPFALACIFFAWLIVLRSKGDIVLGQAPEYSSAIMLNNYSRLFPGFDTSKMLNYSIQTQATLFFKYWYLWLVPNPVAMSVDMREAFATSTVSIYTLGAAAYILYGLLATALLFLGKTPFQRFLAFSLLVPWLLFWTEFTSLRLQEIFVLYRSYLWFIAVVPLLALGLYRFKTRTGFFFLWPTLLIVLAIAAHNRVDTFRAEVILWRDAADLVESKHLEGKQPGVERIYYNLGTAQFNIGLFDDAKQSLIYALNYLPETEYKPKIMFNLALTYKRQEKYAEATQIYRPLVETVDPQNNSAWWLYAYSLEKIGEVDAAHKAYVRACALNNPYACDRLKPGGHI